MNIKITSLRYSLIIISVSILFLPVGCKFEASKTKILDYNSLIISRSNNCNAFLLKSTSSRNDTFIVNYETQLTYLNNLTLNQHFQYLLQDFVDADFISTTYISSNFNYPNRKEQISVNETNTLKSIKQKLDRFQNERFRETINKIYRLDSEYTYYDLIELLNIEYSLAVEKLNQGKFDMFGKDIFELIFEISIHCNSKMGNWTELKNEILRSMKSNQELGQIMVQEMEIILNDICE